MPFLAPGDLIKRKIKSKKLVKNAGGSRNMITKENGQISFKTFQLSDFDIGKKLGVGKFGKVYLVREKEHGYVCALKVLFLARLREHHIEHTLRREVEIMVHTEHPNLIRLFGYFYDIDRVYLIMEFAAGGEVFDKLRDEGHFDNETTAIYIKDLASALSYLHSKNIIHRDIKPENLLLDGDGKIRLSDFGWSVHAPGKQKRQTICGTVEYLPPEMIEKQPHKDEVDTWALGILTYEFLVGKSPFESDNRKTIFKRIRKIDIKFPDIVVPDARDFIKNC
eukprot:UN06620